MLALVTWSYISSYLYKQNLPQEAEAPTIIDVAGEKLIVKTLPIFLHIEGETAPGFEVAFDRITIMPSHSAIMGAPDALKDITYITTEPVNVEARSVLFRAETGLVPVPGCKIMYEAPVKVTIPINRSKQNKY